MVEWMITKLSRELQKQGIGISVNEIKQFIKERTK